MFWLAAAVVFSISILQVFPLPCPCSDQNLCEPIQYDGREIFGYVYESNSSLWETFQWNKLTTIAMIDFFDPELYCMAHENKTRVMKRELFSLSTLANDTLVRSWVQEKLDFVQMHHLDGINLYVDDPMDKDSPDRQKLTEFVEFLTTSFHKSLPHSLVVFNVPWSPYNEIGRPVEGKDYDYQSISRVVDRILIMEYDQRRQAFDSPCLARPTLDLYYGIGGVLAWSNTSLDFNRTILALPCFTLDFECIDTNGYACEVKPSNYRGSKCSSQIGKRIPYNELGNYHPEAGITTGFDEHANFAICNYSDNDGHVHQFWNLTSYNSDHIYELVDRYSMNGFGMYPLNYIAEEIWDILPSYK